MTLSTRHLYSALALLLSMSSCTSTTSIDPDKPTTISSIAHLKSLLWSDYMAVTQPIYIQGNITMNDLLGESSLSIFIQDNSSGIEIFVNNRELHRYFPTGRSVVVKCAGLSLGNNGGRVVMGGEPTVDYIVGHIDAANIDRYFTLTDALDLPRQTITFDQLSPELIDCVVEIKGVVVDDAGSKWCARDPETNALIRTRHIVKDSKGNQVEISVPPTAHFAEEPIPTTPFDIVVIVDYFNSNYTLRPTQYFRWTRN